MPYCTVLQSPERGCNRPGGCDGPYHGYRCGVCTDLILDSAWSGAGVDIEMAQAQDAAEHPDHQYLRGGPRSAEDLWRYMKFSGQSLPPSEAYQPGDMVFFDWNQDGLVEHVSLVSQVNPDGSPRNLVDAPGEINGNPAGVASEVAWQAYHTQALAGHARLGGAGGEIPSIGD